MNVFSMDMIEEEFVVFITYYTFEVDFMEIFVGLHLELFCTRK